MYPKLEVKMQGKNSLKGQKKGYSILFFFVVVLFAFFFFFSCPNAGRSTKKHFQNKVYFN